MTMVVSFSDYAAPARRLAETMGRDYRTIEVHSFPDGESRVQIPLNLPAHLIICESLDRPNGKLIELLLAVKTARNSGTTHITLVAPYLCYMRQDKAFHPGEAVSQRIIGEFLGGLVDDLITVDAHLHRIKDLHQVIPIKNAINLTAATALGEFLAQQPFSPLLLGPDAESRQWVEQVASAGGFDTAVARKERVSDTEVHITLPEIDFRDRIIVLVDDVASSGHTLAEAAQQAKQAGAKQVFGLITHALFAAGAEELLHKAGIEKIWSSDSICHASNTIFLAGMLAESLQPLIRN